MTDTCHGCSDPLDDDPVRDVLSGAEFCNFGCLLEDDQDVFELMEAKA